MMLLAMVAQPRFDAHQNEVFSAKIGISPFTYIEPAKRSSKNRSAGTVETKAITSVTQGIIRSCMIEKVLLSIRIKWPHISEWRLSVFSKTMQDSTFYHQMLNCRSLKGR